MKRYKTLIDSGKYNKDQNEYSDLIEELYKVYPQGIKLPPEYAFYVKEDLLKFLIRLARYKFAAKMLTKSDNVLELGCGSGLGSIFLGQFCRRVTGIDIKSTEIQEARSLNKRENVRFEIQDFFDLKMSRKYDVILSLDVIEHLSYSKGKKMIEKISKHVKKNGMLILGTPSIYSLKYQGKLSQASHVKCYDLDELRDLIKGCFGRAITFSMNDEVVHTGNPKMAWYYFIIAFLPKIEI